MASSFEDLIPVDAGKSATARGSFDDLLPAGATPAAVVPTVTEPPPETAPPPASILGYPGHYTQMRQEAQADVGRGLGQIGSGLTTPSDENRRLESAIEGIQQGRDVDYAVERAATPPSMPVPSPGMQMAAGVGNVAAGAAGFVYSPIGAAVRSILGAPLEQRTGLPKEYPEFAAALALPVPKRIPFPNAPTRVAPGLPKGFEGSAPLPEIPTLSAPRPAPTVAELRAASRANYQAPEVTGTVLAPQAVPRLKEELGVVLKAADANDASAPTVFRHIERFEPDGAMTVKDLEGLRKQLGEISPQRDASGAVVNGPELRAAAVARNHIDKFLREAPPSETLFGNPQAAAEKLALARADHSAAESAETINRKQFTAELRAAVANSGMNVSNTMRARIADILNNPSLRRGYSLPELAMMDRIARGTRPENLLRTAGNILGGGGGAHAFYSGLLTGGVAPGLGYGAKALGNALTARNIDRLNEMVRADLPLGRQTSAMRLPVEGSPTTISDLGRLLAAESTPRKRQYRLNELGD